MTMPLTIDSAGRIVLPKLVRTALDIAPGDTLELDSTGDKITLKPVRNSSPMGKEKGVWVFRTGQAMHADLANNVNEQLRCHGRKQRRLFAR